MLFRSYLDGAEGAMRAAVAGDPANAHMREQLSRILVRLQRLDEARAAAAEAVSLDPANASLQAHLQRLGAAAGHAEGSGSPERRATGS